MNAVRAWNIAPPQGRRSRLPRLRSLWLAAMRASGGQKFATTLPGSQNQVETLQTLQTLETLETFEAFFRRFERDIFGYLCRMTGEEQSAYDLSQETFLRAWQHFAQIRTYDRPRAWLFRVATNLALNYLRGRPLEVDIAGIGDEGKDPASSDPAWRLAERDLVRQTLLQLAPRQRAGLVLREIYGLRHEEVAQTLGISRDAAKMLLCRAREQFRERYGREEASQ